MAEPQGQRLLTIKGFFYPYRGFRFLLRHPRLLPFVAIPFAINTLLYTGMVWFAASRFGGWMERLVPQGEAWYWAALTAILWVLFAAVLLLVLVYTFTLVGTDGGLETSAQVTVHVDPPPDTGDPGSDTGSSGSDTGSSGSDTGSSGSDTGSSGSDTGSSGADSGAR